MKEDYGYTRIIQKNIITKPTQITIKILILKKDIKVISCQVVGKKNIFLLFKLFLILCILIKTMKNINYISLSLNPVYTTGNGRGVQLCHLCSDFEGL